ncbi:unnamed protein product [Alopecurus aequalis]
MEPIIPDTQPPQAGADAESSALGVWNSGSQAGAEAVGGSVFRLQHPGSGQIPGRIQGGRPPVRASASRCVASADLGSPAVRAKKKISV